MIADPRHGSKQQCIAKKTRMVVASDAENAKAQRHTSVFSVMMACMPKALLHIMIINDTVMHYL